MVQPLYQSQVAAELWESPDRVVTLSLVPTEQMVGGR